VGCMVRYVWGMWGQAFAHRRKHWLWLKPERMAGPCTRCCQVVAGGLQSDPPSCLAFNVAGAREASCWAVAVAVVVNRTGKHVNV
jgi:hypothetical protein